MSELIRRFKADYLRTKKSLGQHFLTNKQFVKEIADAANISFGTPVAEIGPGCGVLTEELAARTDDITVIELDSNAVAFLEANREFFPHIKIIHEDALKVDLSALSDKRLILAGNLPYNVSVRILEHCTKHIGNIERAIFMFQKEVADRISAKYGGKERSSLSVYCEYYYDIKKIRNIGGGNFWPNANVMSSVLLFTPKAERLLSAEKEHGFEVFLRKAFVQKRKTLINNLKQYVHIYDILAELEIPLSVRGEELSLEDFVRIYSKLC